MFTLKIHDSSNAAFEDDPQAEVVRILREVIRKIESGRDYGKCMDANGNHVGDWCLTLPDDNRECPQCNGVDKHCLYCSGIGEVTASSYTEWVSQNG